MSDHFNVQQMKYISPLPGTLFAIAFAAVSWHYIGRRRRVRTKTVPCTHERVLILGASSGIGRCIARIYAARGARVCIVARRQQELQLVHDECISLVADKLADKMLSFPADYSKPEDLVAIRDAISQAWGGLDTLVVNAGVSALRPLLSVAGVERSGGKFEPQDADVNGLANLKQAATSAMTGNYLGPLLSACAFIPMLSMTSKLPAIVQTSSLAAIIPAPTRALYVSSKAASLMAYQCIAIEHPQIQFSYVLPSTVQGSFRASAVDAGPSRESQGGLLPEDVAHACVRAVDSGQRIVHLPFFGSAIHLLQILAPSVVAFGARRKYNYQAQ